MTVEDLYDYGKTNHAQGFYLNRLDDDYRKIIRSSVKMSISIAAYSNIYIPEVLPTQLRVPYYTSMYPNHKAKLQPEHREAIRCTLCGDYLYMFRHIPRLSKELTLSNNLSTYHPQQLQRCSCLELALLVDHQGNPRVYSDKEKFELVTYLPSLELRHSNFTYAQLPPKVNYQLPYQPFNHGKFKLTKVNGIFLQDLNDLHELAMIIPMGNKCSSSSLSHQREYMRRYAYHYSILIATREYLYLPNGVMIATKLPFVRKLLDVPPPNGTKMPKYYTRYTTFSRIKGHEECSEVVEYIVNSIIEHYKLPKATLKYYPRTVIAYLNILKGDPSTWEFQEYNNKIYSSTYIVSELKRVRRIHSKLFRHALLHRNLMETVGYTIDNFQPTQIPRPPLITAALSNRLNPFQNPKGLHERV